MRKGEENEREGDGEDTHIEKLSEDTMNLSFSRQIMLNQFTVEVSTTEHICKAFLFLVHNSPCLCHVFYSPYVLSPIRCYPFGTNQSVKWLRVRIGAMMSL